MFLMAICTIKHAFIALAYLNDLVHFLIHIIELSIQLLILKQLIIYINIHMDNQVKFQFHCDVYFTW